MKKSPLFEKSFNFAVKIVKLSYQIQYHKKEYVLTKQILKSGTSIAALISEGQYAQSSADMISKFSIALKEANETSFWLMLLKETEFMDIQLFDTFFKDLEEIIKMLTASIKTLKSKQK
jgi:four helix bundle protein